MSGEDSRFAVRDGESGRPQRVQYRVAGADSPPHLSHLDIGLYSAKQIDESLGEAAESDYP